VASQSSIQSGRSIFISYRREDSEDVTGRIYDNLIGKFSPDSIFKDVQNIEAGEDFRKALERQVAGCRILLAIVGQHWAGDPRLQDEGDFVRIEVESALNSGRDDVLVIPVLVGNASMPSVDQLPSSMKDFAFRNASKVRPDPDFHQDMAKLIKILMDKLGLEDHSAKANGLRRKCGVSGREVEQTDGLDCPECKHWVCYDEFITDKKRCRACESKAERKFKVLLQKVYADGIIEPEERRELKQRAQEWQVDSGRALELEGLFKTSIARPLGEMQQIQLDESRRLLFKDMNAFGCLDLLCPVFDAHRDRYDDVGEKVRRLYLLAEVEINPRMALELTETILGDYDDPQSYFMQMEYYERTGDKKGMLAVIGRAEGKFPNHAFVQGGIMKHCLDQYAREKEDSYLNAARNAYDKITSGKTEPIIRALKTYYLYSIGNKAAFAEEAEKKLTDEEAFHIRKLKNELNASRLELEISEIAYRCNHGNVLGKKGDIARAHLGAIPTVHSKHAELFCCFGQWHIRALPTTQNPTYVDDHLVDPGETHKLTGEHRLRLSSKFEGRLRVMPVNPSERV